MSTIYFLAVKFPPSVSVTDTVSGTCHTWTSLDVVKFRSFGVAARSAHRRPGVIIIIIYYYYYYHHQLTHCSLQGLLCDLR
jgi:hypothetical protein